MESTESLMSDQCDSYLPLGYYVDFLEFLAEHREQVEVITYADLCWGDDYDYEQSYPGEWQRWRAFVGANAAQRSKVYVLLQHDVDAAPERTLRMLEAEAQRGIRSNVMVFNRRIDRPLLRDEGRVEFCDYTLDDDALRRLEASGFVIGYHANAYEQARFDMDEALRIFERDVAALRERFTINYFSAHGGVRDRNGLSNSCLRVPPTLARAVRWVNTGHGPRFDGNYSDGGMGYGQRPPEDLDLRRFVERWRPGKRYRVLVHPQYYDDAPMCAPSLASAEWYQAVLASYREGGDGGAAAWRDAKVHTAGDRSETQDVIVRVLRKAAQRFRYLRPIAPEPPRIKSPIFVRGMSRSGGTLLVTILDAHPEVAMSYELYPKLLEGGPASDGRGSAEYGSSGEVARPEVDLRWLRRVLARTANSSDLRRRLGDEQLRVFFARCARSGLSFRQLAGLVRDHLREDMGFAAPAEQLRFVERCCVAKMVAARKKRWGLKCSDEFQAYLDVWPRACFVNVIRDGRDVLASQSNTGSFPAVPEEVGESWARTHTRFHGLVERTGVRAYEMFYEDLVRDPETEVRKLCGFLGLPFDESMLRFHEQDLTVYKASHLSMERIKKPIDTSMVGRWKGELTEEQLRRFYATAGAAMEQFGYRD